MSLLFVARNKKSIKAQLTQKKTKNIALTRIVEIVVVYVGVVDTARVQNVMAVTVAMMVVVVVDAAVVVVAVCGMACVYR